MRHGLRRLVRTILGGANPRAGTGLLTCCVTLASALWVSVSVPNLPLLHGFDDHTGTSVSISLQSALLGIDDRRGGELDMRTLARRLGLSADVARLLTPAVLRDGVTRAALGPVAAQLDQSVAVEAAPAVQPPDVPRAIADSTSRSSTFTGSTQPGTTQPTSGAGPDTPDAGASAAPSHSKSGGGAPPATEPSTPPPTKQQPAPPGDVPSPPAPVSAPVDAPPTAPAADPPSQPPPPPAAPAGPAGPAPDTAPPVIHVHADLAARAAGPGGANVSYTSPSATDAVDGAVAVTCLPASGSAFAIGHTTVTCTAGDAAHNTAHSSFEVVVADTTSPVLQAHADLVVEATGASGAAASYTAPAASDLVDGSVAPACAPASGTVFALGHTTVTCTAQDAAGNVAHSTFDVDVRDTTAPVLEIPADLAVAATSPAGAVVSFTATATDVVDGADTVSCTPASGTNFAVGQTTVTCSTQDAAGNEAASQSFSVFVTDTQSHSDAVHSLLDISDVLKTLGLSNAVEHDLHGRLIDTATTAGQGDQAATCQAFDAFTASAGAQLTAGQFTSLTPSIDAARTTLGC